MNLTNEQKVKVTIELLNEEIEICKTTELGHSRELLEALELVRNYIKDCNEDYFED